MLSMLHDMAVTPTERTFQGDDMGSEAAATLTKSSRWVCCGVAKAALELATTKHADEGITISARHEMLLAFTLQTTRFRGTLQVLPNCC
jgi:hypothetical protein